MLNKRYDFPALLIPVMTFTSPLCFFLISFSLYKFLSITIYTPLHDLKLQHAAFLSRVYHNKQFIPSQVFYAIYIFFLFTVIPFPLFPSCWAEPKHPGTQCRITPTPYSSCWAQRSGVETSRHAVPHHPNALPQVILSVAEGSRCLHRITYSAATRKILTQVKSRLRLLEKGDRLRWMRTNKSIFFRSANLFQSQANASVILRLARLFCLRRIRAKPHDL